MLLCRGQRWASTLLVRITKYGRTAGDGLGPVGCDAVSLDKCFHMFCSITLPSPAKVEWTKKTVHSYGNTVKH